MTVQGEQVRDAEVRAARGRVSWGRAARRRVSWGPELRPAALARLAPVVAAAAVAVLLARLGAHRAWPPAANGWTAGLLDLTLLGGILASLALAALRWVGRGGRRGAVAAVAVPLATGLTAAGMSFALLGLVLTGLALHWLGFEF